MLESRFEVETDFKNGATQAPELLARVAAWEAAAGADDEEFIYALFRTTDDETFASQQWLGEFLLDQIE